MRSIRSIKTAATPKLTENEKYRTVKAVWPAIVDEEKFYAVQELLKKNFDSRHNGVKRLKHSYILNSGLLWCAKCASEMEGVSAIGHLGVRYYYYVCKNHDCRVKIPASEIENAVLSRMKAIGTNEALVTRIVQAANEQSCKELPQLRAQKDALEKELHKVKNTADDLMNRWAAVASDSNTGFLKEKLDKLASRRKEIESASDGFGGFGTQFIEPGTHREGFAGFQRGICDIKDIPAKRPDKHNTAQSDYRRG